MKKNRMMRLASILLVCVLLTTSVISGTFAKYISTAEASDTARVAKWGVELTVDGEDVFATEYDGTVKSSVTAEDVVAPGTKNDTGVTFSVKGTPEVAFKLTANLSTDDNKPEDIFLKAGTYPDYTTEDNTDTFSLDSAYYPVVFTLVHTYKEGSWPILTENVTAGPNNQIGEYTATSRYSVTCDNTNKEVTIKGTLADINAVLSQVSSKMKNVNPNYILDDTFKLTWEWEFGDSTNNKADTMLGNIAANAGFYAKNSAGTALTDGTDYNLDLKYGFNITIEQVD